MTIEQGSAILITGTASVVLLAVVLAIVLTRVARRKRPLSTSAEWIGGLSTDRYRPMRRLLDPGDLDLLASEGGYDRERLAQFRAERCRIFRGYLREMTQEFNRICEAIQILVLQSQVDRPDLAVLLLKQKLRFFMIVAGIQCRLLLYRWNLGSPDLQPLFSLFSTMRGELARCMPAFQMAAA